ncbi:hypothetical protein EZV62_027622 [Acer yangbiense]|uniref:CCHC-type domain-containing protein n=1 Tax=Acer yangbiense TaxID=1000413 RepID=A0A5C7GUE0_9ROSI|nr:hypothetical protein EZV62_027622 [Acer yangbiense]
MRCDENILGWSSDFISEFRSTNAKIALPPRIGVGIVIRDHEGLIMVSSAQSISTSFLPQVVEAMALLQGIKFAMDTSLVPAIIESDAKSVVDIIRTGVAPLTDIGVIINDILSLINCYNFSVYRPECCIMSSEDITRLCANMSLLEKEGPVQRPRVGLKKAGAQRLALCLVGKVLNNKVVNRDAFLGLISKIWKVKNGLEIESVTTKNAFLRVRVRLDVEKSLRRCLCVDIMRDGEETVMLLYYERLPNHCFMCGRMGHLTLECIDEVVRGEAEGMAELPFGAWMKAIAPYRWKSWKRFQPEKARREGDGSLDKHIGRSQYEIFPIKASGVGSSQDGASEIDLIERITTPGKRMADSIAEIEDIGNARKWGGVVGGSALKRARRTMRSAMIWLSKIGFLQLDVKDLTLVCVIMWRIWYLRNLQVYGSVFQAIDNVYDWSIDFITGYQAAMVGDGEPLVRAETNDTRWMLPLEGFYKVNCDAAIDVRNQVVGVGLVIHNQQGFVMAVGAQRV